MDNCVLVSVIVPCYNHGSFLQEAIDSIVGSDNITIEILVVDDGSTDPATISMLDHISDPRVRLFRQTNKGQSSARNVGIRNSSGKYILPLDSDNKIHPDLLSKSIRILESNPEIDVVYTDSIYFGEKNGIHSNSQFNLQRLFIENYIDTCSVIRKATLLEVGLYDEEIQGIEDWDLWLRMVKAGKKFFYIEEPLFYYRYRMASFIRKDPEFNRMMKLRLQRKHSDYLNFELLEEYSFQKFSLAPIKYTLKFSIRKFLPSLYNSMIKKGLFKKY